MTKALGILHGEKVRLWNYTREGKMLAMKHLSLSLKLAGQVTTPVGDPQGARNTAWHLPPVYGMVGSLGATQANHF